MDIPDWIDTDYLKSVYVNHEKERYYFRYKEFFQPMGITLEDVKNYGTEKLFLKSLNITYIQSIIQNKLNVKYGKIGKKFSKLKYSELVENFNEYLKKPLAEENVNKFRVTLLISLNDKKLTGIQKEIDKHLKNQHCWLDLDSNLYIQDGTAKLKMFKSQEIKICTNSEIISILIRKKYCEVDSDILNNMIDFVKDGKKILISPERNKSIRKVDAKFNDETLCIGSNIESLYNLYLAELKNKVNPYDFGINKHISNMENLASDSYYNLDTGSSVKNPKKDFSKDETRRIVSKDPEKILYYINILPEAKPIKKYKKKAIPKPVRSAVWRNWSKDSIDSTCFCCMNPITIENWEAGHILAESNGGPTVVENLRPICGSCNKSMGATNMYDFIREYNLPGVANIEMEEFRIIEK